jgi:hypothetical protein
MPPLIGPEADIPNPALAPFAFLIGEWTLIGHHPYFPDTELHGRASFEWLHNGAFLMMRTEIDEPKIPSGISIFGSDDNLKTFSMLSFDERGVSRVHGVSIEGTVLEWWRDDPAFSQHFTVTVSEDGKTMTGKGRMKKAGADWEGDLELAYTRVG